jgi:hypothetical protein
MSEHDQRDEPRVIHDPVYAAWFQRMQGDALWFLGQQELVERYAGSVVVLHNRQVIGRGKNHSQAKDDACRQVQEKGEVLPPLSELLFIPLPAPPDTEPASHPSQTTGIDRMAGKELEAS